MRPDLIVERHASWLGFHAGKRVFDVGFAEPPTPQLGKRPSADAWVIVYAALSLLWFCCWLRHDSYMTVFTYTLQPSANGVGGIRAQVWRSSDSRGRSRNQLGSALGEMLNLVDEVMGKRDRLVD